MMPTFEILLDIPDVIIEHVEINTHGEIYSLRCEVPYKRPHAENAADGSRKGMDMTTLSCYVISQF